MNEKASARSRYVLIAMIFVSILMFGGTWKQSPLSWFDADYDMRYRAHRLMADADAVIETRNSIAACKSFADLAQQMLEDRVTHGSSLARFKLPPLVKVELLSAPGSCGYLTANTVSDIFSACAGSSQDGAAPEAPNAPAKAKPTLRTVAPIAENALAEDPCRSIPRVRDVSSETAKRLEAQERRYRATLDDHKFDHARRYLKFLGEDDSSLINPGDRATRQRVREHIAKELEERRKLRNSNELLVHMPVFGVVFHVNDLGILGGFAIFVLLLWMRAALDEEVNGLQATKQQVINAANEVWPSDRDSHDAFLARMYELLSMQQFFFRPQPLAAKGAEADEKFGSRALRYAVIGLVCLPLVIEIALFITDLASDEFIIAVNRGGYLATLICSGAFTTVNLVLTFFAVSSAFQQVTVWKGIATDFAPH